jgi:hypothetical protein
MYTTETNHDYETYCNIGRSDTPLMEIYTPQRHIMIVKLIVILAHLTRHWFQENKQNKGQPYPGYDTGYYKMGDVCPPLNTNAIELVWIREQWSVAQEEQVVMNTHVIIMLICHGKDSCMWR